MSPADVFAAVKGFFAKSDAVTVNSGRGSQGIKYGSKMFVMFYQGQLLVQLPPARVAELIESGEGVAHDPGTGKPMTNRVLIPASRKEQWIELCEESLRYVSGAGS
jgi:hypothetical protein